MKGTATIAMLALLFATPGLARQMECSYDYITHVTTLRLDDMDATRSSIPYSFIHSVSPVGGEEMFLFNERDQAELRGTGQLVFIMEKLFLFDPLDPVSAIAFVDFERPTLKEFQFPAATLEQSADMINAPLVVWLCHRSD